MPRSSRSHALPQTLEVKLPVPGFEPGSCSGREVPSPYLAHIFLEPSLDNNPNLTTTNKALCPYREQVKALTDHGTVLVHCLASVVKSPSVGSAPSHMHVLSIPNLDKDMVTSSGPAVYFTL